MTAESVRALRAELGDSLTAFAKRAGVSRRTVQNWESGVEPLPSHARKLRRIRQAQERRKTPGASAP